MHFKINANERASHLITQLSAKLNNQTSKAHAEFPQWVGFSSPRLCCQHRTVLLHWTLGQNYPCFYFGEFQLMKPSEKLIISSIKGGPLVVMETPPPEKICTAISTAPMLWLNRFGRRVAQRPYKHTFHSKAISRLSLTPCHQ